MPFRWILKYEKGTTKAAYVYVLYCVLFYWYLLCSRKADILSYLDTMKILYSVFCSHSFRITDYTPSASLLES